MGKKALQEGRRAWEAWTWAGKSSEDSLRDVRNVWGQGQADVSTDIQLAAKTSPGLHDSLKDHGTRKLLHSWLRFIIVKGHRVESGKGKPTWQHPEETRRTPPVVRSSEVTRDVLNSPSNNMLQHT